MLQVMNNQPISAVQNPYIGPFDQEPASDLIERISDVARSNFPDPARDIIGLCLSFQDRTISKLNQYEQESSGYKNTIDALLTLQGELQRLPQDQTTHILSEKAQSSVAALREKGIDIFPGANTSISKEELLGARSLINSRVDENRMKLQDLFATKISVLIQTMNSVIDITKDIARKDDRAKSTIISNFRSR